MAFFTWCNVFKVHSWGNTYQCFILLFCFVFCLCTIIILILQMWKLRQREFKQLAKIPQLTNAGIRIQPRQSGSGLHPQPLFGACGPGLLPAGPRGRLVTTPFYGGGS